MHNQHPTMHVSILPDVLEHDHNSCLIRSDAVNIAYLKRMTGVESSSLRCDSTSEMKRKRHIDGSEESNNGGCVQCSTGLIRQYSVQCSLEFLISDKQRLDMPKIQDPIVLPGQLKRFV